MCGLKARHWCFGVHKGKEKLCRMASITSLPVYPHLRKRLAGCECTLIWSSRSYRILTIKYCCFLLNGLNLRSPLISHVTDIRLAGVPVHRSARVLYEQFRYRTEIEAVHPDVYIGLCNSIPHGLPIPLYLSSLCSTYIRLKLFTLRRTYLQWGVRLTGATGQRFNSTDPSNQKRFGTDDWR